MGQVRRSGGVTRDHEPPRGTCPLGPGAVFAFGVKGGRDGGASLHRGGRAVQPPRQRRRRPHPRHPSGVDHAPAARRRSLAAAGVAPTSSASRSGSRTSTTSCTTSTGPSNARSHEQHRDPRSVAPADPTRALAIIRSTSHGRHARRVRQPRPAELLRGHVPRGSSTDFEVWFVNPRPTRSSAGGVPVARRAARPARPRRRVPAHRGPARRRGRGDRRRRPDAVAAARTCRSRPSPSARVRPVCPS